MTMLLDTQTTAQKGLAAIRFVRALAIADGDPVTALAFAERQNWSDRHRIVTALKATVDAVDTDAAAALIAPVGVDFAEFLRPLTVVGRLQGMRRAPFETRLVGMTAGAVAHWVGEVAPKPATFAALAEQETRLNSRKVVAFYLATVELMRASAPVGERLLLAEWGRAAAQAVDIAFLDPANSGDDTMPPAVTHGAATHASTGSTLAQIDADLALLVGSLNDAGSSLEYATWIMHPRTALYLARLRGTGGALAHPGMTARGGELLGLPVLTSANVQIASTTGSPTTISLIDGDGILLADDGEATLSVARHASVQADDDPQAGAQAMISLWQQNMIGLRAERFINWRARRDAIASVLTGVAF
jgi:hypothetical protein